MLDYKDLKDVDLKLHLLSGEAIKVDNLLIKPYTLEEIKNYGYLNYMRNLQLISISVEDFISSIEDLDKQTILQEEKENIRALDFYTNFGGEELLNNLIKSLSMIFRTDDVKLLDKDLIGINFAKIGIIKYDDGGNLFIDEKLLESLSEDEVTVVSRNNFDQIVEVVKLQNYLSKPEKSKSQELYADEASRKLAEDMERHRQRVEAKKKAQQQNDGEDNIDISDIVSAVSSKSNSINKLNIWEFTLYQIYDEYSRLELIDNYDFSIRAMMAGAEKVDLKHWSSKI